MKATLLESYEAGGITGFALRERIRFKLADQFYENPQNLGDLRLGLIALVAASAALAMLLLLMFSSLFESLRLGFHALDSGVTPGGTFMFLVPLSFIIAFGLLFQLAVVVTIGGLGDVKRRLDQYMLQRSQEEVEI